MCDGEVIAILLVCGWEQGLIVTTLAPASTLEEEKKGKGGHNWFCILRARSTAPSYCYICVIYFILIHILLIEIMK